MKTNSYKRYSKKLQYLIYLLIFSAGMLFTFQRCQKEEEIKETGISSKIPKSNVSYSYFLNKINSQNIQNKNNFIQKFNFGYQDNKFNKGDASFISYLDTLNIIAYEYDNIQTYTFNAVTKDQSTNSIYNVVFYTLDETLTYSILKYEPNIDWLNNNSQEYSGSLNEIDENGNILNTIEISTKENIQNNQTNRLVDCIFSVSTISVNCTGGNHAPGEPCDCGNGSDCTPAYTYSLLDIYCPGMPSFGDGVSIQDPEDGNSVGGSNSSTDNSTNLHNGGLPTYPILSTIDKEFQMFINGLSIEQQNWIQDITNSDEISKIKFFIETQNYSPEAWSFVEQAMEQMIHTNLKFDMVRSFKSPVNINFTDIDSNTPEGQLLLCIYDKLTQSASFKELFLNTFTQDDRINVCMQIGDTPGANGTCEMTLIDDGTEIFYNNTITINTSYLDGTHSNFEIAKTIIHEFIHAYLNILNSECSNYCNTCIFNGTDLPTVIDEFYQQECSVGAPNNSEHAFMFDYMIPAFESIFNDIGNLLTSSESIDYYNGSTLYYNENGITTEIQNHSFNMNEFYKFLSMHGLHTNSSFEEHMINNPIDNQLYQGYGNFISLFSKTCN